MPMAQDGMSKLVEEMGELLAVIGKWQAYGVATHPDGGKPLLNRMEEEMADVLAAIAFVQEKFNLNSEFISSRMEHKYNLYKEWDAES